MKKVVATLLLLFVSLFSYSQDFIKEKKYAGDPLFDFVAEWWGTRYRYGGTTKKGIDCSAFTGKLFQQVYNQKLPRTASEQYRATKRIPKDSLRDGDLVFFRTRAKSGWHVGVYLTDGWFVHSSSKGGVKFSNIYTSPYSRIYYGSGRLN